MIYQNIDSIYSPVVWYEPTKEDLIHDSHGLKIVNNAFDYKFADPVYHHETDLPWTRDDESSQNNVNIRPMQEMIFSKLNLSGHGTLDKEIADHIIPNNNNHIVYNPNSYNQNKWDDKINDETKNPASSMFGSKNKFGFAYDNYIHNFMDRFLKLEDFKDEQDFLTLYGEIVEILNNYSYNPKRCPEKIKQIYNFMEDIIELKKIGSVKTGSERISHIMQRLSKFAESLEMKNKGNILTKCEKNIMNTIAYQLRKYQNIEN